LPLAGLRRGSRLRPGEGGLGAAGLSTPGPRCQPSPKLLRKLSPPGPPVRGLPLRLAVRGQVQTEADPRGRRGRRGSWHSAGVCRSSSGAYYSSNQAAEPCRSGLASSDVRSSLRVAVCQYGARPMPLRHCQLSGCEMATEIRLLRVPLRSVADADRALEGFLTKGHSKEPLRNGLHKPARTRRTADAAAHWRLPRSQRASLRAHGSGRTSRIRSTVVCTGGCLPETKEPRGRG
jgi:hypothetical protein